MIRTQSYILCAVMLAFMFVAMPTSWAKKKIILAQQLDPIIDPNDCKVCHPVIEGGEEIELVFQGIYAMTGLPKFVSQNVEIKVYAYHKERLVWQTPVLKPTRIARKTELGKTASLYYVNFSSKGIPLSLAKVVTLKVKLKNLSPTNSSSGNSVAAVPTFRPIMGYYNMYFNSTIPKTGEHCYTKPGCKPATNTYTTQTKNKLPKQPVRTNTASLKLRTFPVNTLQAGKKLIQTDARSGNRLYAQVVKSSRGTRISSMEVKLKNGQVLKLTPKRVPADRSRTNWGCRATWKGYVTSYSHPRLKYKVYYANCGGGKLRVQYPYKL